MPAALIETIHDEYEISTDPARVDIDVVHRFLSEESYWAMGRDREVVARAIANSNLVVGAYAPNGAQVGFARMVTDLATWGWLCDVFVLSGHRGSGLGSAMVATIVEHPEVAEIHWQFLATADAHGLYAKFGFTSLDEPQRWMHRRS